MATRKKTTKKPARAGGVSDADIRALWERAAHQGNAQLVVSCRRALEGSDMHRDIVSKALARGRV